MHDDAVVLAFLERLAEDRRKGAVLPLAAYQGLYPGFEHAVADAYARAMATPSGTSGMTSLAVSSPTLRTDDNRIGPYQLLDELGRGGQGVVHRARDVRVDRPVALKVLTGLGLESEDARRRFQREATIASKLSHPNICTVYEADTEDGVPYIAMEVVDGVSLARFIAASKAEGAPEHSSWLQLGTEAESVPTATPAPDAPTPTDLRQQGLMPIVELMEKTARALHFAHESGIVHRDLKPGNIMITAAGEPVLMDFGLARSEAADHPTLTATGDLLGTPAYMSPEQLAGQRIGLDRRADVYSLGVALYESLTLRRPFDAPTREGLYQAVLTKEPPDPRKINRAIPPDLKVVLETALEKDRDRRYQTAQDLAQDLRRVRMREPIAARPIGPVGRTVRWARRHPARAALALALLIGIPTVAALSAYAVATRPQLEARRQQQIDERVERLLEEGFFELGHGDARRAEDAFEAALAERPQLAEPLAGLALANMKLGRSSAALDLLAVDDQRGAGRGALLPIRIHLLRSLGRREEAEALRAQASPPVTPVELFVAAQPYVTVAHRHPEKSPIAREAYEKARQLLHQAVLSAPVARRVYHLGLAHVIGHLGDVPAAEALAAGLPSLWPGSASAHFWRGYALPVTASAAKAAAFREAIRIAPGKAAFHQNLGSALNRQGHLAEAEAAYRMAVRLDPDVAWAHASLGWTLYEQERVHEALHALRDAIRLDPEDPVFHHRLGVVQARRGRIDEALTHFQEAVRLDPEYAVAHDSLGNTLGRKGRIAEAEAEYREAIRLDPESAAFHYNFALHMGRQRKPDEAIAALREAVRLGPEDAEFHSHLGAYLSQGGQVEEAIQVLENAVRLDSSRATIHANLGASLIKGRKLDRAIAALREALRIDPGLRQAHFNLGSAFQDQGRLEEAIAAFRESSRLDPGHTLSREKFLHCFQKLVRKARQTFRRGDVEEAVSRQERVLELMAGEDAGDYTLENARRDLARFREAVRQDSR